MRSFAILCKMFGTVATMAYYGTIWILSRKLPHFIQYCLCHCKCYTFHHHFIFHNCLHTANSWSKGKGDGLVTLAWIHTPCQSHLFHQREPRVFITPPGRYQPISQGGDVTQQIAHRLRNHPWQKLYTVQILSGWNEFEVKLPL